MFVLNIVEDVVAKGENAGSHQFSYIFNLSSANTFKRSKILSCHTNKGSNNIHKNVGVNYRETRFGDNLRLILMPH